MNSDDDGDWFSEGADYTKAFAEWVRNSYAKH